MPPTAPKTAQTRYQDAITYLTQNVDAGLAQHLAAQLGGAVTVAAAGAAISLEGYFSPAWSLTNPDKRQALRALLLCQYVYYSPQWSRASVIGGGWQADDRRWPNMRRDAVAHWAVRSEAQIVEAIRAFVVTENNSRAPLVTAAQNRGDENVGHPRVDVTRTMNPFPGSIICYTSVMLWLFRSGIVSYRWLLRHATGDVQPVQLAQVFGPAQTVWAPNVAFTVNDALPPIAAGMIVHMYVDLPTSVGGHWLVSDGNGRGYGRNNDEEGGLVSRVYDLCNLDRQFLAYKRTITGQQGQSVVLRGQVDVIDPLAIPNRI